MSNRKNANASSVNSPKPSIGNSVPPAQTWTDYFREELSWIRERRHFTDYKGKTEAQKDDHVKHEEGEWFWIRKHRKEHKPQALDDLKPGDAANTEEKLLLAHQEYALHRDLCGLAISGGGIRSATFGLGVLQGLAAMGLLPRFDYLSTVSGGGYIGSWLSAWIARRGFKEVEQGLLPPRMRSETEKVLQGEPDEIVHLRRFSNYLAPRPGVLSADGWVLIAIYLRNILIIQLPIILLLLSIFCAVRFFVDGFTTCHQYFRSHQHVKKEVTIASTAFAVLLGGAIALAAPYAPITQLHKKSKKRISETSTSWPRGLQLCPMTVARSLVLIAAVLWAAVWLVILPWPLPYSTTEEKLIRQDMAESAILCTLTFSLITGAFGCAFLSSRIWGLFAGLAAGLLAGGALCGVMFAYSSLFPTVPVAVIATLGVPTCLASFVLAMFLMVGFCGDKIHELEREWSSVLNSRIMMLCLGWTVLLGVTIYSPYLLSFLPEKIGWPQFAVVVGWIATLMTTLNAAQSSNSGGNGRHGIRDIAARMAPFLFAVTLFVGLSIMATWLMYLTHSGSGSFLDNVQAVLTNLNCVQKPIDIPFLKKPIPVWEAFLLAAAGLAFLSWLTSLFTGVNTFSLHNMYRNRLVRCYLGASNTRRDADTTTGFDFYDDMPMASLFPCKYPTPGESFKPNECLKRENWGPIHLINGALNLKSTEKREEQPSPDGSPPLVRKTNIDDALRFIDRQAESFVFTPLCCGSDSTGYCRTSEFADPKTPQKQGDTLTPHRTGVSIGTAIAVSGAAVSPNMGYHSSPLVTSLLTFFNIRLGAWFGNPRKERTRGQADPTPRVPLIWEELLGKTTAERDYVYVSDGGHFENMGVYELVRRRCRFIVAVDSGADPQIHENIGRLIRQVRIDFGIGIDLNPAPITPGANGKCNAHVIVGRIHYGDAHPPVHHCDPANPHYKYQHKQGIIVWIKPGLTGDEPGDILNHFAMNPSFPYDTTVDQFFSERQFESYRALGVHSVLKGLVLPAKTKSVSSTEFRSRAAAVGSSSDNSVQPVRRFVAHPTANAKLNQDVCNELTSREIFENIYNCLIDSPQTSAAGYIEGNRSYLELLERLNSNQKLQRLAQEVYGQVDGTHTFPAESLNSEALIAEKLFLVELFCLLEIVWLNLELEHHWQHPMNQGWIHVFKKWYRTSTMTSHWLPDKETGLSREFNRSFVRFLERIDSLPDPASAEASL